MAMESGEQRGIFGGHSRAWPAGCLLAMFVAMVASSTAQASIICPEPAAIGFDDLLSASDAGASSASLGDSRSAPAERPSQDGKLRELARLLSPSAIPSGGSTSGTSASGSGASASSASALGSATAIVLCDADVVRWVAGDERLALPMPPGNDLLRPPQAV